MKKTLLLLSIITLLLQLAAAQDTVRFTVCTTFWKTGEGITNTVIFGGGPSQGMAFQPDSTKYCADFEFIVSQFMPGETVSFGASIQDKPLNGVTIIDVLKLSKHILGIELLPAFGMLAGDVNGSGSISTFDVVEIQKFLKGIYINWPSPGIWRFIPSYSLPFSNPSNPFQGTQFSGSLTASELQAFNGDTIKLIGYKKGDVDGDANFGSPSLGTSGDSLGLFMPDIQLQAGVPVSIPVYLQNSMDILGMQLELWGSPGTIVFDTITAGQLDGDLLSTHPGGMPKNKIRFSYVEMESLAAGVPLFFVHLISNSNIALKDALQIRQADFQSMLADSDCKSFRLVLSFSNSVSTNNPKADGLRILAARPNPFVNQAQLQIDLDKPASVLLEVLDLTGKTLFLEKSNLTAGIHFLEIPGAVVPQGAMVLYRVTAGGYSWTGKLMKGF